MFHKRAYAVAYVVFMLLVFGLVCMSLAATLPQARAPMPTDPSTPQKSSLREKLVGKFKLTKSGQSVGKLTSGQLEAIPEEPPAEFKMTHHDWSFGKDRENVRQ
ncbi:hypothetical protein DFJ43DRAFT_1154291 [Lentinula guzmanii]|uniref:Uncharacterized protein n=1 Tax=Lentinula guzmanii TaxID=2804957 RepID=A0AA38JI63_9AGAR|nr:hypothetical protein DFJ43DRAFT_1154291 [Lentinula guzmanii]